VRLVWSLDMPSVDIHHNGMASRLEKSVVLKFSMIRNGSFPFSSVQFNLLNNSHFSEEKSVKGQPEKMSLEPCSKLTATDGRQ